MSPRIVIAALLFASSAACAVPSFAQTQSPSSLLDLKAKSESSTPAPSAMQTRPAPTMRSLSAQKSADDTTNGKAVLTPPGAIVRR
jgi:hypothetical protein